MKQLIEQQREDFEKRFKIFEQIAHDEVDGTFVIEHDKEKVWNWHKQSLKQFIDGLIVREEGEFQDEHPVDCIDGVTPVETYGYEATYNQAKKETISHLKELKEQLN